jgi:hypothetical protein
MSNETKVINNQTFKKLSKTQEEELLKPLPIEALKVHPTKPFLTVINPMYVVERLNNVFGIGNWVIKSRVINQETSHIVVQALLTVPEYGIEIEAFGGNRNDDLGDSFKGASTDALTKAASYLGIGIDIYKGIGPKLESKGETKAEKKELPWLNKDTVPYNNVVVALKKGGHTIAQVKTKYKLSKTIEAELQKFLLQEV